MIGSEQVVIENTAEEGIARLRAEVHVVDEGTRSTWWGSFSGTMAMPAFADKQRFIDVNAMPGRRLNPAGAMRPNQLITAWV